MEMDWGHGGQHLHEEVDPPNQVSSVFGNVDRANMSFSLHFLLANITLWSHSGDGGI